MSQAACLPMYRAIVEEFDRHLRAYGRIYPIGAIYEMVANTPAPSFFISENEANRIICSYSNKGFRPRKRELINQRDKAFLSVYCQIKMRYPDRTREWIISQAVSQPAPRYYIGFRMVSYIVRNRKKW